MPRPRHIPCSQQICGWLLWKGRTHFRKRTAGCLAGGRRPDSFTGRLRRRGSFCFSLPSKSACYAAKAKAVQQAFAFCSLHPPQRTRTGTAFPPGGRNQFWLIRYTVRNRRQKAGGFGPSQRQRYWKAKGRALLQSKIPLYGKFNFTKGSAASRKKHPPVTGRLCRSRRGLAGKFSPCIIARPAARQKAALLPRRCQGCSFPAAKHFLPSQAGKSFISTFEQTALSQGCGGIAFAPAAPEHQMQKINIPRRSRGDFRCGHSPLFFARTLTRKYGLPAAKVLLLAARKRAL